MSGRVRISKSLREQAGQPPGTPVFMGTRMVENVSFSHALYDEEVVEEGRAASPEECAQLQDPSRVLWLNVEGIHDVDAVERLGKLFGLHPLTIEDVVNTTRRPKYEDYGEYLFLVLKMLSYDPAGGTLDSEQVSLVLGKGFVITFQEKPGDVFDPVRERIRTGRGRLRRRGADYLAYALIDSVVDSYFLILEAMGDRIEELEDRVVLDPEPGTIAEIHGFKRAILFMRRTVWPLREEIVLLEKSDSGLIDDSTSIFLRNVYDHTIQVIDTMETYRDLISGMHDTYLTSVSNRMNEVMKVLTIIATIFIPLTFIAGVYGMNFLNMPELEWGAGYFITLGVMLAVALFMLLFFRRKRWI